MNKYRQQRPPSTTLRILIILAISLVVGVLVFSIFYYGVFNLSSGQVNPYKPKDTGTSIPSSNVQRYERYELTFPFSVNYSNPNDPAQVDVETVFTAPSGMKQTVPGFFFQDFTRSGNAQKEILKPVPGSEKWKVRYAPSEIGSYTFVATIHDSQGTRTLGNGSFNVVQSSNPGFVRAVGFHLKLDNGKQFIPLGINAPGFQPPNSDGHRWGDGTYGVDVMYQQLVANGADYFHLWTCSWNSGRPTPFAKPNIGCNGGSVGTEQMSQPDSWEMDYMVDQAHAKGIYIMPILKHLDQQRLENADKIKARYFVARWGYSTNIMAWDFCKEGCSDPSLIHNWASYMASVDTYKHLLTTSQFNHFATLDAGRLQKYNQIFSDPLITLVQSHDYTPDCPQDLTSDPGFALFYMKLNPSGTDPRGFRNFNKPSFFGETGVHSGSGLCVDMNKIGQTSLYSVDRAGLIMNSEVWGMLMGTSGGYAPWFFQFDPNGTWTQLAGFKGVRAYVDALPSIPDSAKLFTNYHDDSQAVSSNAQLLVYGRKNATFAMLIIQNTNGTVLNILRGHSPSPTFGSVTLKNMQVGSTFTVHWYNADSGTLVKSENVVADKGGLVITTPNQITQNIAAIITG